MITAVSLERPRGDVYLPKHHWAYLSAPVPWPSERKKLPAEYWIEINDLLVAFGQNHCHPVSPRCSVCRLAGMCARVGVGASR